MPAQHRKGKNKALLCTMLPGDTTVAIACALTCPAVVLFRKEKNKLQERSILQSFTNKPQTDAGRKRLSPKETSQHKLTPSYFWCECATVLSHPQSHRITEPLTAKPFACSLLLYSKAFYSILELSITIAH